MKKTFLTAAALMTNVCFASTCPELNGRYERQISKEESVSYSYATQIVNGKYQYNFDADDTNHKNFWEADGIETKRTAPNGQSVFMRVSCTENTVSMSVREDGGKGQSFSSNITILSPTEIKIETTPVDPEGNGVFTKR